MPPDEDKSKEFQEELERKAEMQQAHIHDNVIHQAMQQANTQANTPGMVRTCTVCGPQLTSSKWYDQRTSLVAC